MPEPESCADFMVCLAARFLKDPAISADGYTRTSYVLPRTIEQILGWSRYRRERAQRELEWRGWLRLGWKRRLRALVPARLFFALRTVARIHHSGEIARLIIDYVLRRDLSSAPAVRSSHH